ncbi:MAG: Eco57I restriction-modification methylase domain-containing protein [Methanobacteriales archaeon]|nr:Eco57I restriction-modification methylase domain-containing protein [Methanobacteriales archaeon]
MELLKVKEEMTELIEKYEGIDDKRSYSEANVRKDFIDPFFKILGWNVRDSNEYNAEEYVRGRGYVDIALKIDNRPVIFVEAKKFGAIPRREPQTTLYGNVTIDWTDEERQALNYAGRDLEVKWAALTNFEKFRLFNAYTGEVVLDIEKPEEYLERIDDIILLSKENVKGGEIDKIQERIERPDIDEEFLNLMRQWRMLLAREINEKFPEMDFEEINFYVQRILDRLVVIRYAEDKWVLDKPDQLKRLLDSYKGTDYVDLSSLLIGFFDGFDKIHNTKIFEKNEKIDEILKRIDDGILASIIEELYMQNFRKFKSDILGNTYEAYLATKLRKEDGKIKLESDEEARKGMGIYYTPTHVVEYIVENTLGIKLEKIWKEVSRLLDNGEYDEAIKRFNGIEDIKVLDLACGSGSFLIKAYDFFEKYYKKYKKKIEKIKEKIRKENQGKHVKITDANILNELDRPLKNYRWKILKKNLYGVDLDKAAAEIASINLMLKALKRGEKLPLILEENIKVGNSIITGVENKKELLEHAKEIKRMIRLREKIKREEDPEKKNKLEKEYKKIREDLEEKINENLYEYFENPNEHKPFNYELEFPEVFYDKEGNLKENGGFDVIIGNPPYRRQEKIKNIKPYLKDQYETYTGTADLYTYFMERSLKFLNKKGLFSFITSNKYTRAKYGQPIRKWIQNNFTIKKYYDYTGTKVFKDATVDPAVIVIENKPPTRKDKIKVNESFYMPQEHLDEKTWTFEPEKTFKIKEKIEKIGKPLKEWNINIYYGIKTGFNEAFIISGKKRREILDACKTQEERKRTAKIIKPILRGKDIDRYFYDWNDSWIILVKSGWTNKNRGKKDPEKFFRKYYPTIYKHLISSAKRGKGRGLFERDDQGDYWWELRPCDYYHEFEKGKIVWQEMAGSPSFVYDKRGYYTLQTAYIMTGSNLKFLLGVLNSKVAMFYLAQIAYSLSKGALRWIKQYVERIPVPSITEENKKLVEKIEGFVDQILVLNKQRQFLIKSFRALVENIGQGRMNSPLGQYLKPKNAPDYSINLVETKRLIDDEKVGLPRFYKVKGYGDSLIISVGYDDGLVEDVIQIVFEDPVIKEFFHFAIASAVEGKKKAYRSQKKILETLLEDIKVPRSTRNKKRDVENIKALMEILKKEYEKKDFKDSPAKTMSLQVLDDKIREVDEKIDELVYKLYGFSESEKEEIEKKLL